MALTLASIAGVVVRKIGGKLGYVGLPVTIDGTNAVINDAIGEALPYVGLFPADPPTVTNADVATVTGYPAKKLIDATILETLRAVLGASTDVDSKVDQNQEYLSQFQDQTRAMLADYENMLAKPYGPAVPGGAIAVSTPVIPYDPFRPCPSSPCPWPYPS